MVGQSEIEWWGDVFSVTCAFGGAGCRMGDTSKSLVDAHQTVLKAFAESSVELRENTEQVKRLVAKVDSYFGSAPGFDYDN